MTPDFIPGLTLAEAFYHEAVRPVVDGVTPGLPHSAALIGPEGEAYMVEVLELYTHPPKFPEEIAGPESIEQARQSNAELLPGREVDFLCFGSPRTFARFEENNAYLSEGLAGSGSAALALTPLVFFIVLGYFVGPMIVGESG